MIDVVSEAKVPMISLAASEGIIKPVDAKRQWVFKTPQTDAIMAAAIAQHMQQNKVKTVGYIGFNDAYGEGWLAELKKNPGKYSYSSSGTGGIGHLQMELFKNLSGTFVTHIPYRGAGPALNDTVGGQVPMIFDNLPSALPFIKDGRLIAIVVAAPQRLQQLPNVPTFKEVGLEPVNRMAYYGILGPKDLPREIVDKIGDATRKALADPAVRARIEATDSVVVANTPEQFAAQIKAEYAVYKQVVAKQKLKLD